MGVGRSVLALDGFRNSRWNDMKHVEMNFKKSTPEVDVVSAIILFEARIGSQVISILSFLQNELSSNNPLHKNV